MTTFAIGEVAILQNSFDPRNNGRECVIIGGLQMRAGYHPITGDDVESEMCYETRTSDGARWFSAPHQLRKRRPPSIDESESRQAMLDCIERAKQPIGVEA